MRNRMHSLTVKIISLVRLGSREQSETSLHFAFIKERKFFLDSTFVCIWCNKKQQFKLRIQRSIFNVTTAIFYMRSI
jgi:hypothetical protein